MSIIFKKLSENIIFYYGDVWNYKVIVAIVLEDYMDFSLRAFGIDS